MMKVEKTQDYNADLATRERVFDDDELKRISKMSRQLEFKSMIQNAAGKIMYGILAIGVGVVIINIL